jgi:hypothetical protein
MSASRNQMRGGPIGRVLSAAMLLAICVAWTGEAFARIDRTLVMGREGWYHEASDWQGILRVGLTDPDDDLLRPVGLMMLSCTRGGHRLHFSLDGTMRQRVGRTLIDGFAHFIADAADDEVRNVSIYVSFQGAASFRSIDSVLIDEPGAIPALIELLRTAGRTVTLVLSPRPPDEGFARDVHLRLILEPGADASMEEGLLNHATDCHRRRR